jgi:hypothetical protein
MIFRQLSFTCIAWGVGVTTLAGVSDNPIDRLLAQSHSGAGIATTDVCDDATFLRRLSLDLIGRVPTVDELQQFLADPDRLTAVDRLLASEEHPAFWSQLWASMLLGRGQNRETEPEVLRRWLQQQLSAEAPVSQIAFRVITAQGVTSLDGPVNYVVAGRQNPVMRLSRTFLSIQLDCAQCHDHPHDRWTNEDYLNLERFYRSTQFREVSGGVAVSDRSADGKTPVFLTGRQPHTAAWRRELGLMVVQTKPFSRAMVNRTWHWLMGRGLIDPVDGLSRDNPASIPPLLEELSDDFRAGGFQLRPLIRRICNSAAYQRRPLAKKSDDAEEQLRLFAARNVRTLLPEQWIASVAIVLDRPLPDPTELANAVRNLFQATQQPATEADPYHWKPTTQTLIQQLAREIPAPLRDVDLTFLATVGRLPKRSEQQMIDRYGSQEILFALVHSNEFMMND